MALSEAVPLMESRESDLTEFRDIFRPYAEAGGIPLNDVLRRLREFCSRRRIEFPRDLEQLMIAHMPRVDADGDGRVNYTEFICLRLIEVFYPYEQDGGIPNHQVEEVVRKFCHEHGLTLPAKKLQIVIKQADADSNGRMNYKEFVRLMMHLTRLQKVVQTGVQMVVPRGAKTADNRDLVDSYIDEYKCCPPPLFIILISVVEVIIFVAYIFVHMSQDDETPSSQLAAVPRDSPLIYQPARRYEAWRFLTYMLLHDGFGHIISNLVFQLLLGIPLEMVHQFWRIGLVYCLGVITGSLATSLTDPWTLLCGASGGCYALIGAHFAKIIMNWNEMNHKWLEGPRMFLVSAPVQLIFFSLYMIVDTGYAIYMRYFSDEQVRTAYAAHFAGFLGGVLIGIPVLRNLVAHKWELRLRWVALAVFMLFIVFAVCFNIFYAAHFPPTDWRACCPMPCLSYPVCY